MAATGNLGMGNSGQVTILRMKTYAIAFVVIGVALVIGLRILGGVKEQINDTTAQQGATQAMEGLSTFTEWLPLL
ncbi:hypothetical protein AKJ51_04695, partial [candidate division MSBL1 archaeon SCGC-AAA382A20]